MSKRKKLGPRGDVPQLLPDTSPPPLPGSVPGGLPNASGRPIPFLTRIAQLMAVDDTIYAPGGILSHVMAHPQREALVKEAREHAGTGFEVRETLLAIGVREFGMKPFDLGKAVPLMLSPMTEPGLSDSFYLEDIAPQLRNGHALLLSDPHALTLVELLLNDRKGDGAAAVVGILVGVVPWTYALLVRKTEALRRVLQLNEGDPSWERGIAFEPHLDAKAPFVRTVRLPHEPEQAAKLLRWLLLGVVHAKLTVPPDARGGRKRRHAANSEWLGPVPPGDEGGGEAKQGERASGRAERHPTPRGREADPPG
ncbi:MAG: hypothetical protein KGJ23_14170 [Euryarchaeota archaeon]|nr:hypothetical protein [Euryarchaeota archaeon]MDE1837745.1 hypothetical protein [Euryarchaeota archaeon]MDE1881147.1 hypothetical protein [Euryarchaeota archaeon]MDE2045433.1 hypothetical protein [Thermoplasmata archaeon]